MPAPVWVFDTSSLIALKSAIPREQHEAAFEALTRLARNRRVYFPREVIGELRRERRDRRRPRTLDWALAVEEFACRIVPSFEDIRAVLARVPESIDPSSESLIEEANPYVLALARTLQSAGHDARVVAEETRDAPPKVSLHTACGVLRIPCVELAGFFRATRLAKALSGAR